MAYRTLDAVYSMSFIVYNMLSMVSFLLFSWYPFNGLTGKKKSRLRRNKDQTCYPFYIGFLLMVYMVLFLWLSWYLANDFNGEKIRLRRRNGFSNKHSCLWRRH